MKGGSRSVKEHKWFSGMDWEAVYKGQVGDKHVVDFIPCLGNDQYGSAYGRYCGSIVHPVSLPHVR